MVRPPCCETLSVNKRGVWTPEEDAKMIAFVSKHGSGNWTCVPKKAGLKRCEKSCRLRWTNYLRPDLKHDSFAPHEEDLILKLHAAIGSRWSMIAQQLPRRTDNDVKNYWNTKLKKKLASMGIDPVTHKPFSKLLADYGNIGSMQKPSIRIGSLSEDLKNTVLFKSDPFPKLPPSTSTSSPKLEPPTESSFSVTETSWRRRQSQQLYLGKASCRRCPARLLLPFVPIIMLPKKACLYPFVGMIFFLKMFSYLLLLLLLITT